MKKLIAWLIIMMIMISGCSQEAPDNVGAYTAVIDKLYIEDMALNNDIKYIAVDTSLINSLSVEETTRMLKEIEKYGYTVLNKTFEELEQEGYIKDLYFEEGILFKIKDEPINRNSITMDVSKWRSGLGAIGYDDLRIEYINGRWEITKAGSAWIS